MSPSVVSDPILAAVTGGLDLRSFAVDVSVFLPVHPRRCFVAFTTEIDRWWTYRIRDGARSVIEPQAGGRWLQAWENGELLFGTFTLWDPPQRVRVAGPLAMDGFAHNVVDFSFAEADGGTRVNVAHRAIGDFDPSAAELYRTGWHELLDGPLRDHLARS